MDDPSWRGESGEPGGPTLNVAPSLGEIPPAPRTPSKRARQLIFRYQGSQLAMLIIGLVFSGIGGVVTLALGQGMLAELALTLSRTSVTGHVIDTRLNRNVTVNGEHPTMIRFSYQAGGEQHMGESSTRDQDRIAAAIAGAEVPIEVASGHPTWARMAGTGYSVMGLYGLLLLIFPLIGLTLTFFAVRSNRREIRAFTDGKPITAKVVFAGEDMSTRINGRHPLQVCWEFKVDGEIYKGSISTMTRLLIEDLMQKEELTILYEPMNPDINTVWIS